MPDRVVSNNFFSDSEERIDKNIHPSTRQMVELMCLNKIALLRISFNYENFGTNRESEFDNWPSTYNDTFDTRNIFDM